MYQFNTLLNNTDSERHTIAGDLQRFVNIKNSDIYNGPKTLLNSTMTQPETNQERVSIAKRNSLTLQQSDRIGPFGKHDVVKV